MKNEIKILCPARKCRKCSGIKTRLEKIVSQSGIEASIKMVDSMDEILSYPTWILPTIIVNGKVVARGYAPPKKVIMNHLNASY